ncbi:hypothetical protein [Streptomyces synnematoformans]|uniref:Uncharacterized protein n=1 Tax=Streptomyces synnematoformans TaxID=415721 RepID=A0ABN2XB90_9ACTN
MTQQTNGTPGRGRILPQRDEERILGQIDRGEVRAGRDAAREIAARHEAAYGDVWHGRGTGGTP